MKEETPGVQQENYMHIHIFWNFYEKEGVGAIFKGGKVAIVLFSVNHVRHTVENVYVLYALMHVWRGSLNKMYF